MTEKQLKENERRISVLDDYDLSLFRQNMEMSVLDKSSKDSLLKLIKQRREKLSNTHNTDGSKTNFYDVNGCEDVWMC